MPLRLTTTITSCVLAGSMLAACGSDTKATIPKATLVSRADTICKSYDKKLSAVKAPSSSNPSDSEITTYFDAVVKLAHQEIKQLQALPNADKDAAKFTSLFADVDKEYTKLGDMSASDIKKLINSGSNPLSALDARAKALGLTNCGSGS